MKSFLAQSGLKHLHTYKDIFRRSSLYGISPRISNSEFNLVKDDYIKAIAEATNWPAHYIRAEWQSETTILVKFAVVDESTKQSLQSILDGGETFRQALQEKIEENQIKTLELISTEASTIHDIPSKPYVMIYEMDCNVNINFNCNELLNFNFLNVVFVSFVQK